MRKACESAFGFTFTEAHPDEGLKRFRARVGDRGSDGAAIRSAVSVGEREPGRRRTGDDERAAVGGAVMGSAKDDEIVDEMFPALAATLEVVRLRKVRNVVREASRTMPADELLDVTHRPAAGCLEPLLFGGRNGDARELACDREVDPARLQLPCDFGSLFEGFGDAELVLRELRAVAEETIAADMFEPPDHAHSGRRGLAKVRF
jgi:hypothetical protein